MNNPPKCSPLWLEKERMALAAWIAEISMDRIQRDSPNMPVVAKEPVHEVIRCIHFVLTKPASVLEDNRAALEKPYDPSKDRHSFFINPDNIVPARSEAE